MKIEKKVFVVLLFSVNFDISLKRNVGEISL